MSEPPTDGPAPSRGEQAEFWRARRARFPGFREAVRADARVTAAHRGERHEFYSRSDELAQMVRLAWQSDAFAGQILYRAKAHLQARGIPILPRLAHRLAMTIAQISIGDPALVGPGIYIVHGQVVIDGLVEIHSGVVIAPFVTIGLRAGDVVGPVLEAEVSVGTGAKLIGPIRVGRGATVGAGAIVVDDVPAGTTVAGAPARVVGS